MRAFPRSERYVQRRLLGTGAMGAVWEAEDRTTGGRVALKVLTADGARRILRFKEEFRVMADLHHPNLVRLLELGQQDGVWFFTMELVEGYELRELLVSDGSGACDPDALVGAVGQVLDALAFLHGRGIVHRDLKPSNVLVDLDGRVRVCDFGLARRLDATVGISATGAVVGTLAYLSPEQLRGEPATPASDLYSLGGMMYQLWTGRLPPRGSEVRVEGAPPSLAATIERLLAPRPADRPGIADIRAALGLGEGGSAGAAPAAIPTVTAAGPPELDGWLDEAAGGRLVVASVPLAAGDGGALAAAVVRRAEARGFRCLRGSCYERERLPFVAFDRIVDALVLGLRRAPAAELAPLLPSLLALEQLFPTVGVLIRARPVGEAAAGAGRGAFDGFVKLVAHCHRGAPLCFVIEDLQWADEDSVALLEALEADGGALRLLVVGLVRDGGASVA